MYSNALELLKATRQILAEYPDDQALQIQARAIDTFLSDPATTTPPAEVLVSRDQVLKIVARIACPSSYCVCSVMIADQVRALPPHGTKEQT